MFSGILPEIADIPQVDFYDYLILEPWDVVNNDSAREALLLRSPFSHDGKTERRAFQR